MNLRYLRTRVEAICDRAPEAFCSVYAKNLLTGQVFTRNEDVPVQAASVIKTCILAEVMNQAHQGRFGLDDLITVDTDPGGFGGSGIIRYLRRPLALSVYNLATLMIIISDNTASNMCIRLVGFDSVNKSLQDYGCENTALRRYFIGTYAGDRSGDNIISTGDLGLLYGKMYNRELVSPEMSDEMISILKRQTLRARIPLHLPEGTVIAHKTGTQATTAHDAGIVYGPEGNDYILAIAVAGVPAQTLGSPMVAEISKAVWDCFTGGIC